METISDGINLGLRNDHAEYIDRTSNADVQPAAETTAVQGATGLFGVVLFFVGAVLFVNGLATLGRADAQGAVPINLFVGAITLLVNVYFLFGKPFGQPQSYYYATTGLLFSFTYLWNGINNALGLDGRAFGWFCLFVALTAGPASAIAFKTDWRWGTFWASWGALWFLFFLILALGYTAPMLVAATGYLTVAEAVFTCWVPGFLILVGKW